MVALADAWQYSSSSSSSSVCSFNAIAAQPSRFQHVLASAASLIAVSLPMPVSQPVIMQAGDEGRGLVWFLLKSHANVSKANFTSCHARSPGTATVPANNDSIFVLSEIQGTLIVVQACSCEQTYASLLS
jgi:hypothetical protein